MLAERKCWIYLLRMGDFTNGHRYRFLVRIGSVMAENVQFAGAAVLRLSFAAVGHL